MPEITITEKAIPKREKPKPFDWHEHAVTHDELLRKQLAPIDFLVEGMLVGYGTGILAGPKKKGKSWMGLQLAQAVASGTDFLGHMVTKGSVIHFALEDGERRTQARLSQQHTASGLPITYFYSWPHFNTPLGLAQLRSVLLELKPSLVVVDTLAKCLNGKPDQNSAGDMGEFGNRIHDLALEMSVMILFIAHHGKMSNRDPGFDIRGSSAIPGSTDVNIGLYKNDDGTFELMGEGRDIEEFDIRVKLDKEITWCWTAEGDAKDVRRVEAEANILDAIATLGGEADAAAIAVEVGTSREAAQTHLKRMWGEQILSRRLETEGRYRRILYRSLTSLTTTTPSSVLQPLHIDQGVGHCKGQGSETGHAQSVRDVRDVGVSRILGMSAEQALAIWRKHGAPVIHLAHGVNTFDLELTLSAPDTPDEHLAAIAKWLDQHRSELPVGGAVNTGKHDDEMVTTEAQEAKT